MSTVKTKQGTELPLLNLKGKAYLQVAHRLVWFREERPEWSIETTLEQVSDKAALSRAIIRDPSGRIIATGHKSETVQGFPDFIEKSETGAIGRALALCGYGTQFTDDLEEGDRLADSPIQAKHGPRPITPDPPGPDDGDTTEYYYKIPFGKWSQRTVEEVFKNHGDQAIRDYIDYLEQAAQKKGKTIDGVAKEFIDRASQFLVAMEQQWAKEAGSRG